MGKKLCYGAFIGIFLAVCLTLSLGTWIAGPSQAGANEQLSKAPALRDRQGNWNDGFLADTAAWVNDHFYLRQELISTDHLLTGKVFRTSGEDSVILGRDGWLFYGATVDDYTGLAPMTERELFSAARNLYIMQGSCKDFAFMIAPNKNSLYPQFMPSYGVPRQAHDGERLMALLEQMGVSHIDLFSAFRDEPILYYATDSHWNQRGAALAADLINREFSVQSCYYTGNFVPAAQLYTGDLYNMLYPAFGGQEQEEVYADPLTFTYEGEARKPDSITLRTKSPKEGSILVYRDSFGNLLYPYIADSFGSARFSRSTTYDLTGREEKVLIELVERNLTYLIEKAPVSASPVAQVILPEAKAAAEITREETAKAPEGLTLWRGTLPEAPDDHSSVYIACNGVVYEAYLLKDNGFAVYLPEAAAPDTLGYFSGGTLRSKTTQTERTKP